MKEFKIVIQKLIATIVIIVMTMMQCYMLGYAAVTYAIDMLATNSDNVVFKAYFKDGNEEKVTLNSDTEAKNLKLYIDVAVKNEGYFNGKISLQDSNFRFKEDAKNNYIDKIENNVIYLKQVSAGETAKIEVDITLIEDNELPVSLLSQETMVKLEGTYYNSKGNTEINGVNKVTLNWIMPENTKEELATKLLTNTTYKIGEENKKVTQILVENKLTNNAYPVKNTTIEMNVPDGAEVKEVHKRTTNATNGDKEFSQNNYKVENNKLIISVDNSEVDGKISWKRNTIDSFVVTYHFQDTADLSATEIKTNAKSIVYNSAETILTAQEQTVKLDKTADGAITVGKSEKEPNIYKGKIYAGEERDYTSYTKILVDYSDAIKDLEITENEVKFIKELKNELTQQTEAIEKESNIHYKNLKINKANVTAVLGNTWTIKVKDQGSNEQTITQENETDEDGNITIICNEDARILYISTSKPINNGIIEYETTKAILNNGYTRNEIKELTKIADSASAKFTKNDNNVHTNTFNYNINLKETESKASFNLSSEKLSTLKDNQNIELVATLDAKGENTNLYKNPTVEFTFPKEVKEIKVNQAKALYKNGLEVEQSKTQTRDDGRISLFVKFVGEQKNYDTNGGLELHLYLDITVDNLIPTKNAQVEMKYTNENDETNKTIIKEILLESQNGLLVYDKISNYNSNNDITVITNESDKTIKLDLDKEKQELTQNVALINNFSQTLQNVAFIVRMPVKNEKNTFTTALKSIAVNDSNAKVYFSKNADAINNDSSWSENSEGAVAYKITIPEMEVGKVLQIESKATIPANLSYNQVGYLVTETNYTNGTSNQSKTTNIVLKTEEKILEPENKDENDGNKEDEKQDGEPSKEENIQEVDVIDGLKAKIATIVGNSKLNNGDNVYEGSTIKYQITLENNTGKDYTNINIKATQTNGKVWGLEEKTLYNQNDGTFSNENYYRILDSEKITLNKIESLKNGQKYTIEYEVMVDLLTDNNDKKTYGTINITSENGELNKEIKTIENNIKDGKIQLKMLQDETIENYWLADGSIAAELDLTNLTNENLTGIETKIIFSKELSCDKYEDYVDISDYKDRVTIKNKEKNSNGDTIVTLKIASILSEETMRIYLTPFIIDFTEDEKNVSIIAQSTMENGENYYSNMLNRIAYKSKRDITIEQKAYKNNKILDNSSIVNDGEEVEFETTIINKDDSATQISITNGFPLGVQIEKATLVQNNKEIDKTTNIKNDSLFLKADLGANEKIILREKVKIETKFLSDKQYENTVEIIDLKTVKTYISKITINTNKIIDEYIPIDDENIDDPSDTDENNIDENAKKKYNVTRSSMDRQQ